MRRGFAMAALIVAGTSGVVLAQSPGATPAALDQIHRVAQAMARLGSPDSAHAAGFDPVFGWFPMMGTHWVNSVRMDSAHFDMQHPDNLMFSPVNGRPTLVGAAYAYFAPVGDTVRPATFDGSPGWHEHANLAPPGKTLVMLHVWFVPSPDGPFAGYNPNLPYWALGLTPPDSVRVQDPAVASLMRRTALALAEVVDSAGVFPNIARRPAMLAILSPHRATIRTLIPELDAAQKAGDWSRWAQAATRLAAEWDAMQEAYLAAVQTPEIKARIQRYVGDMTSAHAGGHHH